MCKIMKNNKKFETKAIRNRIDLLKAEIVLFDFCGIL
jgi:hypothetical protein